MMNLCPLAEKSVAPAYYPDQFPHPARPERTRSSLVRVSESHPAASICLRPNRAASAAVSNAGTSTPWAGLLESPTPFGTRDFRMQAGRRARTGIVPCASRLGSLQQSRWCRTNETGVARARSRVHQCSRAVRCKHAAVLRGSGPECNGSAMLLMAFVWGERKRAEVHAPRSGAQPSNRYRIRRFRQRNDPRLIRIGEDFWQLVVGKSVAGDALGQPEWAISFRLRDARQPSTSGNLSLVALVPAPRRHDPVRSPLTARKNHQRPPSALGRVRGHRGAFAVQKAGCH